jgi:crossover junction endodeoxyribonuclease RusA
VKRVAAKLVPYEYAPLFAGQNFKSVTVTLPDPPSANRWWRMVTIRGSARMLLSSEARKYKAMVPGLVREQLGADGAVCFDAVRVTLDWYRERRSGDLDKRLGVVFDALQGVLYLNDSQVVEIVARRHEDAANPRVVVTVEAL